MKKLMKLTLLLITMICFSNSYAQEHKPLTKPVKHPKVEREAVSVVKLDRMHKTETKRKAEFNARNQAIVDRQMRAVQSKARK